MSALLIEHPTLNYAVGSGRRPHFIASRPDYDHYNTYPTTTASPHYNHQITYPTTFNQVNPPHVKNIFAEAPVNNKLDLNANRNGNQFDPMFYGQDSQKFKVSKFNLNNSAPHQQVGPDQGYSSPTRDINGFQFATTKDNNNIHVSPTNVPLSKVPPTINWEIDDGENSDDEEFPSHPNKFPVEIEHHNSKFCNYVRQKTRSGEKFAVKQVKTYDPVTLQPQIETQSIKSYQKHLVRMCRCGKYEQADGILQQGRANDCSGYEIHYSQKCRWKAYDDFKTGERVLIRLCKCYRPIKN